MALCERGRLAFRGLDLNLLAVFEGLMQTHSVSETARQMHLSQPAMSAALSRLRDYFGDPLLVSHGKRMYPTAFAESLAPLVRECLGGTCRTVRACRARGTRSAARVAFHLEIAGCRRQAEPSGPAQVGVAVRSVPIPHLTNRHGP